MQTALEPTKPLAPQLIAVLKRRIAAIELAPGSALSEKDIAAQFRVSRQPVREAFIKLSEAGLVEIRPSRGTWVMKISVREVCNARFVREAIESDLARHAAALATPQKVEALTDLIDRQRKAAEASDFAGFNALDETFHRTLTDTLSNDFALRIVETARFQTDRVRLLSLPNATPMKVLIDQHQAILDCIARGDGEGAAEAMRRHLREILLALPSIAQAHPEYFSDSELPDHAKSLVPHDAAENRG
ncbi:GntR family transcriptional regulator [Pararhodobacter marinus]|uniref:GntR family transcriptional regulator n=1 Tax=Pararhodobacter marinus TaxID=2184063 RepID=UPI003511F98C